MSDYFKRTISVLLTNFSRLPLTLVAGILIARYLGPDGKGILALVVLVATVLKLIGGIGIEFANVYYTSKNRRKIAEIFSNNICIWIISTSSIILLGLLLKDWIIHTILPNLDPAFFNFALLIFPLLLWLSFAHSMFQGLEKFREFNLLKMAEPLIKLAAIIVFVVILNMGLHGGVLSITLTYLLPTLLSVFLLLKLIKTKLRANRILLSESIKYGLKGQIGIFFQFFNYRLDVFLVNYFLDISAVGFYTVSVTLAELLWHIPNSVSLTLFPSVSARDEESAGKFTCRITRVSISVMLIGAIILGILSIYLIPSLYGERFSASILPLQILLPGVIAFGLVKILTGYLHGRGKPLYASIVTICSLVLTLIFDFLLIPQLGIIGAALATTIAYGFSLILTIYFFLKTSGLKLYNLLVPDFKALVYYFTKTNAKSKNI